MTPVRMWIGLVLLALGVIGILEATGVGIGGVADWWPIAVIGLGVVAMFGRRRVSVGPLIIVAFGFVLLADQQSWTTDNLFGPALLVVLGLAVLFGLSRSYGNPRDRDNSSFAMFGGTKVTDRSEHLKKADATAVFGGVTLDLREARIDDAATVDAFALFGGVDILVPRGWRVSMTGTPFLGGFDDKTRAGGFLPPDAPVLNVDAIAIFGGVTVANEPTDGSRPQDHVGRRTV
ncbi:cell wall-active antibiotic response 4TMS protein YvqF [Kribbella orskensis]|uniref:Cell wall-active antibiotic response 4TMS protein YvqF n=1 Tax=Kribbella orskensis TaxID=2512216 RepID=A0ABY2BPK9_9ACTN|nr:MULTISPECIES: LiaF domain-containing protein [Kribbella]TCN42206.1 cell wall-active antibiotic response 4TMS protein YvqF [Kribbella sp. VKM Ac-2500]TCO26084.1 cell wall-active antibiotic response 4TMS protein YvqF [Kribbella orskensis]